MPSVEISINSTQGLELDPVQRRVRIDGKLLPRALSWRQFELLKFLAARAGKVCLREETSRAVYGERYIPQLDDARFDEAEAPLT